MSRNALNLLRSATSSVSHLAVARSYCPTHRRAVLLSRAYSDTTASKASESSEGSGSAKKTPGDKQDPVPPPSELEAQLNATEDEVVDKAVPQSSRPPNRG